MGDASVQKLCDTMQKMLATLMEQTQPKSSSSTESLKVLLEPNPVKLTGPGDYFSWARNASLILGAHGMQKYLLESNKKPSDEGAEKEQWEQNEQRVMVWLLGSMEKSVREQVENLQSAAEIWKDIETQFSGKSNKMQVCRILQEMRHIKQGQKSVTEYAGELKKLYRDLEFFRPFKPHDPRDLSLLREWFEPFLVYTFLEGLNPEFNLRSQMIQATSTWPTLEETISSILEEETRLSNSPIAQQVNADTRAALSPYTQRQPAIIPRDEQASAAKMDYKKKTRVICDHCRKPGHVKKNCFEIVGYPPGWQQRQQNRLPIGDNRERRQNRVHFAVTSPDGESSAAAAIALEEYKSKIASTSNDEPVETASSCHTAQGTQVRGGTWDWDRA